MRDLNYAELQPLVQRVAKSVANSFPSYVDRDDLEQAIYIWLLENKRTVMKVIEDDPSAGEAKITPLLRRAAFTHANSEKAAVEGYDTSDVYRYSIEKIQVLLEDVFDYEDWQSFAMRSDGMPRSRGQSNETGDRLAELSDVKAAVERLKEESYNLLVWRYKYNYSLDALAEEFQVTVKAASKRHRAALRGVQKELGYRGPEDLPSRSHDRRAVRSNAAARADLSNHYEG